MARRAVTGITEQGNPACQKLGMVAAMGGMAGQAILFHRRMRPQEGTSFFRMAFIAEFVGRVRLHHLVPEPAMLIVTACAFHLPFFDRMVRLLVLLEGDVPVADVAEIRFLGFQVLLGPRMDRMAGIAGKTRRLMLA